MTFQIQYHLSNSLDEMDQHQDIISEDSLSLEKSSPKSRSASSVDEVSTHLPLIVSKKHLIVSKNISTIVS